MSDLMDSFRLDGKVALVTGATYGIGMAIAEALGEAGAKIAFNARHADKVAEAEKHYRELGFEAHGYVADVTDETVVAELIAKIEADFGTTPDILVNNAGITRDAMSYKMTAGQFDAAVKVSLYGSFYCVQQVVNGMRERGYGRIVSMSSLASRGNVGQLNYASAKAGIIAMTQTLSMELGRYNITANCVAPGMINTDIIKTVPEKNMNAILSNIPMRRVGEPEEVASLVAFLASDEASYISGQCVRITGGWF